MSPRSVLLHIGPHKTGSTSIQVTLTANRPTLEQAGFAYPDVGKPDIAHHDLANELLAGPSAKLDEMAAALNGVNSNLILSSENFSRVREHELRAFFSRIESRQVRVIFYLRSFFPLMFSSWQENVKHGRATTFLEFCTGFLTQPFASHRLNPLRVLRDYAAVFGREAITVYRYDRIVSTRGDVAGHFMNEVVGLANYGRPNGGEFYNRALAIGPVELMRRLNACGLSGRGLMSSDPQLRQLVIEMVQKSAPYVGRLDLSYEMFLFSHLERELIKLWGDRIAGFGQGETILFDQRAHAIEYLRPEIWVEEPALNHAFQRYVEKRVATTGSVKYVSLAS